MSYSVNIAKEPYGFNVSVWDDDDSMYPLAYNNKVIGYSLAETKY